MRIFILILCVCVVCLSSLGQTSKTTSNGPKLHPIQENGKWGYIDVNGKEVIKPQFSNAHEFSEGVACVQDYRRGFLEESYEGEGHVAETFKYEPWGFIDETGEIVIEPTFQACGEFSEGLADAMLRDAWGFIDHSGKWVIKPERGFARAFHEGLAVVSVPRSYIFSYVDQSGETILIPAGDAILGDFSEGYAVSDVNRKWTMIDRTGTVLFTAEMIDSRGFSDGLVAARQNGKWGFVDKSGKFAIEPKYENVGRFSEGLADVVLEDKTGYIDRQGKIVIEPSFFRGHEFSEGLAAIYLGKEKNQDGNSRCGYIDKAGEIVIELQCTQVHEFSGGLACVDSDAYRPQKRGYINKQGKYVWGPKPFIDLRGLA